MFRTLYDKLLNEKRNNDESCSNDKFMNRLFYGAYDYNHPKLTSGTVSRYRNGQFGKGLRVQILQDSKVSEENISNNLSILFSSVSSFPRNGAEVCDYFSMIPIPNNLTSELRKTEDPYKATAKLIVYSINTIVEQSNVPSATEIQSNGTPTATIPFFEKQLERFSSADNLCIDMAFHSGRRFTTEISYAHLLRTMSQTASRIRVLINIGDAIKPVLSKMGSTVLPYSTLIENYENWRTLIDNLHTTNIHIHVTDIPLLHRTFMIYQGIDEISDGASNVALYLYGSEYDTSPMRMCYSHNTPEFFELKKEFDYLWAHSYEDTSIITPDEEMRT